MSPDPAGGHPDRLAPLLGRPASELTDEELATQGTRAHETRNRVFLHGTAEQFATHTSRMLELEQEYLHRHPQRTWQGSGGAAADTRSEAAALRAALRGIVAQLDALAAEPIPREDPDPGRDPVLALLSAIAAAPAGRLHKLAVHQVAREVGLERSALAALYQGDEPALAVDGEDRGITDAGRARLRTAGRRSTSPSAEPGDRRWVRREPAVVDDDVRRIVGGAPAGVFDLDLTTDAVLPGDWWAAVEPDGHVLGVGWMDVGWGEAEILLAVEPESRGTGAGRFVIEHLEGEAARQGLNYVFNTVHASHPQREQVADWLAARGYTGDVTVGPLRKRVSAEGRPADRRATDPHPPAEASPDRTEPTPGSAARGPGDEEAGGYVDVEDHRF